MAQQPFGSEPGDHGITAAMMSDACDRAGLRHQVIHIKLSPLAPGSRLAGFARTCTFVPDDNEDPDNPYDDAIDFIDGSQANDVVCIATDSSNASAFWGELFSAAAKGQGAVGLITDGNVRDVEKIRAVNFPVFARSTQPIDFRGRMKLDSAHEPVVIGGVTISPGDLIVADEDGVVVVPHHHVDVVVEYARERARGESTVLEELLAGSTLRDVWTKHGIL
jgi:4-hydroxy-4-methyl-2-oxoglutarate aldolase